MRVTRVEVETADPGTCGRVLSRLGDLRSLRLGTDPAQSAPLTATSLQAGRLGCDQLRHPGSLHLHLEAGAGFVAGSVRSGRVDVADGDNRRIGRPGLVFRAPTERPWTLTGQDAELRLLRIPLEALQESMDRIIGRAPNSLTFEGVGPVSSALGTYWVGLTDFVYESMAVADSILDNPLIEERFVEMVADAALSVFPTSMMNVHHVRGPGWAHHNVVRRAAELIEAGAEHPLSLSEVAGAVGVSPAVLRSAFRNHLGTTPSQYVRHVRLEGACRELRHGRSSGRALSDVAVSWGFLDVTEFMQAYRGKFGEDPPQSWGTETPIA